MEWLNLYLNLFGPLVSWLNSLGLPGKPISFVLAALLPVVLIGGIIWTVRHAPRMPRLNFRAFAFWWWFRRQKLYPLLGWQRRGMWLGPIQSRLFFGGAVFIISFAASYAIYAIVKNGNSSFFGNTQVQSVVVTSLTVIFNLLAWVFPEKRTAPNNHVLVLKVLGFPIAIYLQAGSHFVPLAWLLFSTNKDMVLGPVYNTQEDNTENPGLVYVGVVTVMLDNEDGQPKMEALASDRAIVGVRPTFRYTCIRPIKRLGQNQPIKDLNEGGRDITRQVISGLATAPQTNEMHGAIKGAIGGARIYFVRTRCSNASRGVHGGDLVINRATRRPMFAIGPSQYDQLIEDELLLAIRGDGTDEHPAQGKRSMLDAASELRQIEDDNGETRNEPDHNTISVTSLCVGDQFAQVFQDNGYALEALPRIGEVDAPEAYTTASAEASAEVPQRHRALADAETARQTAEVLGRGGNLDAETAALAALAEENDNVKIIHIPGGGTAGGGVIVNAA